MESDDRLLRAAGHGHVLDGVSHLAGPLVQEGPQAAELFDLAQGFGLRGHVGVELGQKSRELLVHGRPGRVHAHAHDVGHDGAHRGPLADPIRGPFQHQAVALDLPVEAVQVGLRLGDGLDVSAGPGVGQGRLQSLPLETGGFRLGVQQVPLEDRVESLPQDRPGLPFLAGGEAGEPEVDLDELGLQVVSVFRGELPGEEEHLLEVQVPAAAEPSVGVVLDDGDVPQDALHPFQGLLRGEVFHLLQPLDVPDEIGADAAGFVGVHAAEVSLHLGHVGDDPEDAEFPLPLRAVRDPQGVLDRLAVSDLHEAGDVLEPAVHVDLELPGGRAIDLDVPGVCLEPAVHVDFHVLAVHGAVRDAGVADLDAPCDGLPLTVHVHELVPVGGQVHAHVSREGPGRAVHQNLHGLAGEGGVRVHAQKDAVVRHPGADGPLFVLLLEGMGGDDPDHPLIKPAFLEDAFHGGPGVTFRAVGFPQGDGVIRETVAVRVRPVPVGVHIRDPGGDGGVVVVVPLVPDALEQARVGRWGGGAAQESLDERLFRLQPGPFRWCQVRPRQKPWDLGGPSLHPFSRPLRSIDLFVQVIEVGPERLPFCLQALAVGVGESRLRQGRPDFFQPGQGLLPGGDHLEALQVVALFIGQLEEIIAVLSPQNRHVRGEMQGRVLIGPGLQAVQFGLFRFHLGPDLLGVGVREIDVRHPDRARGGDGAGDGEVVHPGDGIRQPGHPHLADGVGHAPRHAQGGRDQSQTDGKENKNVGEDPAGAAQPASGAGEPFPLLSGEASHDTGPEGDDDQHEPVEDPENVEDGSGFGQSAQEGGCAPGHGDEEKAHERPSQGGRGPGAALCFFQGPARGELG